MDRLKPVDWIEKNLYLGDSDFAVDIDALKTLDIKYVLSVMDQELTKKDDSIKYFYINTEDFYLEDLLSHFPECNEFITSAQNNDENVLVHCRMGVSRSATIVIAFLMKKYNQTYDWAETLVKSKRDVCPNFGFKNQLILYEEMGFTLNSNNQKFRKHLVETILHSETVFNRWSNKINVYFERLELAESMTEAMVCGSNYLCSECGFKLFNELNVIKNDVNESEINSIDLCNYHYIEPQKWMKGLFEVLDRMTELSIKCPHCEQHLVNFKVKFTHFICHCRLHNGLRKSLRFRIERKKLRKELNENIETA